MAAHGSSMAVTMRSHPSTLASALHLHAATCSCCTCAGPSGSGGAKASLPLLCLVPRDDGRGSGPGGSEAKPYSSPRGGGNSSKPGKTKLLDDEYIKKNFKLPKRALYLDPFRRPLITFPMTQEGKNRNFNMAKKQKTNQQILDGFLDASEAVNAPSVFPYAKSTTDNKKQEEDEEIIYILQLPDYEFKCPVHQQTIRTPRFIWHSCKKSEKKDTGSLKQGGGPLNKPKPWLLSRYTDFDLLSQW